MTPQRLAIAAAVVLASLAAAAPRDVSPLVAQVLAKHHAPGLVGAIVDLDGATAIGAAGVRKVGSPELFGVDDPIHLGSDTKAMTATLIAQLVADGTLTFDSTLADCFPASAARMNPTMAKVTVAQLLAHRGGVPANVAWGVYDAAPTAIEAKRRAIVEALACARPDHPPGMYVYSNAGYAMLGAIVEAKVGGSWEQVIAKRLFEPLEMKSAGFGPPGTPGTIDAPWGHAWVDGKWRPSQADNLAPLGPAGRVHCSIADWAKYVAWTLRVARADTPLLPAAVQKQLLAPIAGSEYAGGWIVTQRPWAGGVALTHQGSNTTWRCVAWLAPAKGFAVLAATNGDDADAPKVLDDCVGAMIQERAGR